MARARCPRSSVEAGQKCINLKERDRVTFFSRSENLCLHASNLKPEEREFDVDSGASMHMISKKDLSDAEMDTLTISCSLTIVITANGEVQTHEEAIVYVKELDILLTSPRKHANSFYRSESFAMNTDTHTSGSMDSSTSMTPSRQERHSSTSSSSSSSSPTTASSDSETREREDQSTNHSSPVHVSSSNVDDRMEKPVVCRLRSCKF